MPKTRADAKPADAASIELHHTDVRHHGQRITVIGIPRTGLLALTGYATPRQHVLGIIRIITHHDRTAYHVDGHHEDLHDLDAAVTVLAGQGP